ncbi:MAG TPA: hypothetical protein VGG00_06710, partial [Rhodanobacter sp.]
MTYSLHSFTPTPGKPLLQMALMADAIPACRAHNPLQVTDAIRKRDRFARQGRERLMRLFNAPLLCSWQTAVAIVLLMCASIAYAQSDDAQGDAGDPPARVARLSFASGDLGLLPAGGTRWATADINRPLTNGDKLSSGPGARAELDLGGTSLRIDGQSDIGVLNLDEQAGQFELTQGTLNITVRSLDQGAT